MEPYAKRQRLYSPVRRAFPQSYNHHEYYDIPDSELGGYEDEEDEEDQEEEEEEDDGDEIPDPDEEFVQRRALLDYKLKSTFESIFEKYGKDFDGIGDEIDLRTGNILVNNGHLIEMQDERDIGNVGSNLHKLEEEFDTEEGLSGEDEIMDEGDFEDEDEDENEDNDEALSEGDMLEDDLILRGFAQASQFLQQETPALIDPPRWPREEFPGPPKVPRRSQKTVLPSESDIIAQFGSQLGPQIIKYVAQQNIQEDDTVEPAWRVPDIPSAQPKKRPLFNPAIIQVVRSPSPDMGTSLWAPVGPGRGKARKTATKRKRTNFTAEDDEILLNCVEEARQQGLPLSQKFWKGVEAKYPNHPWGSWCFRYNSQSNRVEPSRTEDSDMSASEESANVSRLSKLERPRPILDDNNGYISEKSTNHQRPSRIRKPTKRDSRIISWSDAANTIKSLDPDLHAGIIEDIRRKKIDEGSWAFNRPHSFAEQPGQNRRVSNHVLDSRRGMHANPGDASRRRLSDLAHGSRRQSAHLLNVNKKAAQAREEALTTRAPCPHADCRYYTTKFYRLQRLADEEQSQMSVHLLHVHHTTPFPCGELQCAHKGDNGFFMQRDLVRHVKTAHPGVGALHRLRGRVDDDLIDSREEIGQIPGLHTSQNETSASQHQDSDFMSPRRAAGRPVTSSSRPFSSSSDQDHTLTPRGIAGMSTYTPMTSVSSLIVNRSFSKATEGAEEGIFQQTSGDGSQSHRPHLPNEKASNSRVIPSTFGDDSSPGRRTIPILGPSPDLGASVGEKSDANHWISTSPNNQQRPGTKHFTRSSRRVLNGPASPPVTQGASPSRNSLPASIPDSQNSIGEKGSSPPHSSQHSIQQTQGSSNNLRPEPNDSSSMAVTEPTAMLPPRKTAPRDVTQNITPQNKPKSCKAPPSDNLHAEEIDELSLIQDGFIITSSRRTARTPFDLPARIKREETADVTTIASAAMSRKRKLHDFQADDDIDELMADEFTISVPRSGPATVPQPKIKTEDAEVLTASAPLSQPRFPRYRKPKAKKTYSQARSHANDVGSSKSVGTQSTSRKSNMQFVRTGTPLLNLTPSRKNDPACEIAESGAERSSQPTPPSKLSQNMDASSPLAGLLTPTRKTRNLGKGGPAIVVKTPGGTMRKCGENGFDCKKSFCFRCTSNSKATVR
ncbi:hypothetical protein B0J14DRAFT_598328 [Halenospora varia]|nr:hypothetical protein B0J14DRAFT_598328 [Halenospora varia]